MNAVSNLKADVEDWLGLGPLEPLTGGRTNYVWSAGDAVVKLYQPADTNPLFPNSPDLEWVTLNALKGQGIAPEPIKRMTTPRGEIVVYRHVVGRMGYADVADAAVLLGRLHRVPRPKELPLSAPTSPRRNPDKLLNLKQKYKSFLHRDPVFSNFVHGTNGLRLVDWQCPAVGDPVEDLAHFLSPGMNVLYSKKPISQTDIDRFLSAYPNENTVENYHAYGWAYHERMADYCAWRVATGDADYAPALTAERTFLETLKSTDPEIVNG